MLDNSQTKIIQSQKSHIIVNAGPGTGKTNTLIAMAQAQTNQNIALITFTNRAADEMRERLTFSPHHIGTIHSFAKKELYKLAREKRFRVRIMKESTVRKIIQKIFEENDFGVFASSHVLNEAFLAISGQEFNFTTVKRKLFTRVEEEYKKYKRQNRLYDYTDTPEYLLQKLIDYDMRLNYDWILVDEAQDLDSIQYDLIQRVSNNVFAIGDPKQSIYLFRGATPEIFNRFVADGYELFTLENNYRSKKELLDYANVDLHAVRGSGGQILTTGEIFRYGPMVLCRTNKEVERILPYYPNVMTIHAAKGAEFNNVCVVDFDVLTEEDTNIMFVALTRAKDRIAKIKLHEVLNWLWNN